MSRPNQRVAAHREKNAEHHPGQHSVYETEGHWFESSRARFKEGRQCRVGIAIAGSSARPR
jgi:hypothetical protein